MGIEELQEVGQELDLFRLVLKLCFLKSIQVGFSSNVESHLRRVRNSPVMDGRALMLPNDCTDQFGKGFVAQGATHMGGASEFGLVETATGASRIGVGAVLKPELDRSL